MKIFILGICGTFMAGIAQLAKQAGHEVSGCDEQVYPPMSDVLASQGIDVVSGYSAAHLKPAPDCIIVGNVVKRGNPALEYILAKGFPYYSGPEWLAQNILKGRHVLAVAGTHGKTTVSSMLTWILDYAGLKPGFLVGGKLENFATSARLSDSELFVVEADEYDTAFHDKRSKFVHYHPKTLVLNNLEYDHADIFPDLAAIQKQFHHLIRTIPGNGVIIHPFDDLNIAACLRQGCWTPIETFTDVDIAADRQSAELVWFAKALNKDGSEFSIRYGNNAELNLQWDLFGKHNIRNALAAIAAAHHAGVSVKQAVDALKEFKAVKRRMEFKGEVAGVKIFDDFAHHPTAIHASLEALRQHVKDGRVLVALEFASHTMKRGVHGDLVMTALAAADAAFLLAPEDLQASLQTQATQLARPISLVADADDLAAQLSQVAMPGDTVLMMSNKNSAALFDKLAKNLDPALA